MIELPISERDRWVVFTARQNENHRIGYGPEALRGTLRHLYDRGDREVIVDVTNDADEYRRFADVRVRPGIAKTIEAFCGKAAA